MVEQLYQLIKEIDELKNGEARIIGKIEKARNEKNYAESVKYINDLYEKIKNVSPTEAMIRAFNIVCPCEKQLPKLSSDE